MVKVATWYLAVSLALALPAGVARAEEPKAEGKSGNPLVGTWKLASAKYGGREVKVPQGATHIKQVTPTQFMWATHDKDGKATRGAGGGEQHQGEVYEEARAYGIGASFDVVKGKAHTFKWKVDGNKWYHDGKLSNGLTIEEVWERDEKK